MFRLRTVFGPAFEAARRALRELDDDQVPADLRRVVAHAGDLPPPLEIALVRAIDRYEWLRDAAVEAWPQADTEEGGAEGASALLLERPHGWTARLIQYVAEAAAAEAEAGAEEVRREAGSVEERLEESRRRFKAASARIRELERVLATRRERERAERRSEVAAFERLEVALERERMEREGERDRMGADLAGREETERQLREELRRVRKDRARIVREMADAGDDKSWDAGDPVGLAIKIDELAAMAVPPAAVSRYAPEGGSMVATPPLPVGVRPDTAEAVAWLAGLPIAVTVLVDGYNVGHSMGEDPGEMRRAVELRLAALARESRRPHRIVVVYDSAEGSDMDRPGGEVDVRFTSAGTIADDEIVELAGGVGGPVVVVTSDRDLRERVEALGAVSLWSEALRDWGPSR